MRNFRIWLGVAAASFALGTATAQNAAGNTTVTITSESWPCMKKWVEASKSAATDPIKFPIYTSGGCSGTLASRPFDYSIEQGGGWMLLRVSEAQCLRGLGPAIDKKLSGVTAGSVIVSLSGCSIKE